MNTTSVPSATSRQGVSLTTRVKRRIESIVECDRRTWNRLFEQMRAQERCLFRSLRSLAKRRDEDLG